MSLNITSNSSYDIISLQGTINIGAIPSLTPQLSAYFQEYSPKDLVIDLTDVIMIDSSIIRLFLNIKKRIEGNKNQLYLMRPSEELRNLLTDANLHKVLNIISDINELQKLIDKFSYDRYFPFTVEDKGMHRLRCTCGACGSQSVVGYLLDSNAYNWNWRNNDFFPYSETKDGQYFDYYSTLPIVCTECLLSSIDISHFNVIDDTKSIHYKTILDDKSKLLLSKSTKKRKKMMEVDIVITDNYFDFPRNRLSSLQAYLLAESCSKAISNNKGGVDSFNIGYMNFLAIQFAPEDQKAELINNCRTWLSQVLADSSSYNTLQMSQSYYILMIVSLSVEKFKEVSKYFGDFSTLIKMVPEQDKSPTEINSPAFWFSKAEMIWQKEIEKKSSAFKL